MMRSILLGAALILVSQAAGEAQSTPVLPIDAAARQMGINPAAAAERSSVEKFALHGAWASDPVSFESFTDPKDLTDEERARMLEEIHAHGAFDQGVGLGGRTAFNMGGIGIEMDGQTALRTTIPPEMAELLLVGNRQNDPREEKAGLIEEFAGRGTAIGNARLTIGRTINHDWPIHVGVRGNYHQLVQELDMWDEGTLLGRAAIEDSDVNLRGFQAQRRHFVSMDVGGRLYVDRRVYVDLVGRGLLRGAIRTPEGPATTHRIVGTVDSGIDHTKTSESSKALEVWESELASTVAPRRVGAGIGLDSARLPVFAFLETGEHELAGNRTRLEAAAALTDLPLTPRAHIQLGDDLARVGGSLELRLKAFHFRASVGRAERPQSGYYGALALRITGQ